MNFSYLMGTIPHMKSDLVGLKGALVSGVDIEAALWEEVRERGSCSVVRS